MKGIYTECIRTLEKTELSYELRKAIVACACQLEEDGRLTDGDVSPSAIVGFDDYCQAVHDIWTVRDEDVLKVASWVAAYVTLEGELPTNGAALAEWAKEECPE